MSLPKLEPKTKMILIRCFFVTVITLIICAAATGHLEILINGLLSFIE